MNNRETKISHFLADVGAQNRCQSLNFIQHKWNSEPGLELAKLIEVSWATERQ